VIAHRDGEDLFRLVLFDHKPVEMRLDIAGQEIEHERLPLRWPGLFLGVRGRGFRFRVSGEGDFIAEVRLHEFGQLRFELVRRWKWRILSHNGSSRQKSE
jgi:hypothetical protein